MARTMPFRPADYLTDESTVREYLKAALHEAQVYRDTKILLQALNEAAKTYGLAEVAERAGLNREALSDALRPDAEPGFDTIARVAGAMGLELTVTDRTEAPGPVA